MNLQTPRFFVSLLLLCACLSGYSQGYGVSNLRCEGLLNPLGIDNGRPHFSWQLSSSITGDFQTAYEIEVGSDSLKLAHGKADVWKSGKVESKKQVMVDYGGKDLQARDHCYWRVRSYNSRGAASAWSDIAKFSVGIIDGSMQGQYIICPDTLGNKEAPVFFKRIKTGRVAPTVIHVNSLGYHEVYVNGKRVSNKVLAPAVTQLNLRSAIVTYDITSLLRKGENEVAVCLGQGWYRSNLFAAEHDGPVVRAEIDVLKGGRWTLLDKTDASWTTVLSCYSGIGSWNAGDYGGERYSPLADEDAEGQLLLDGFKVNFVASAPARVVSVAGVKATPQMFEGNSIIARLRPVYCKKMDAGWMVDLGRNITGWFDIHFHNLQKHQEIKMEYADDLKDGELAVDEYDIYVATGDSTEHFTNRFHSHAYRYVLISGLDYEPDCDDMHGLQITGTNDSSTDFSCSDSDINAIHDMVRSTLRCLTFSGYSVDCPHIERMGYGGDGNSSTMTLQTMFDAASTYYNWTQAWADAQDEDGSMPHVAPAGGGGGGPYWCGFIVRAPYRAYLNYADDRMITKHYDSMKRWMDYVDAYSPEGLLQRWPDTKNRVWYLGDWLTPIGVDAGNERSVNLVSNCFVAECLQSLLQIALRKGYKDDALRWAKRHEQVLMLIHKKFFNAEDMTYGTGSPLDIAYALNVGAVPAAIYNKVEQKLIELQRTKYRNHIAVGLVGVPVFTEWATRAHQANLMYDILKQPDYPGYLDMIRHDATTTWESWDRSRSRIHNCYNGIGTWFYQALGGIVPDPEHPGYEHFTVAPQCPDGIDWVRVKKDTPYGLIEVEWHRTDEGIKLNVTAPVGTTYDITEPTSH